MLNTAKLVADPVDTLLQMGSGLWLSRAVWAATRLRVADVLGDEPMTAEALAAATGAEPGALKRLMNALSAFGAFACNDAGRFYHTDLSRHLRGDHPRSMRGMIESVFGDEHYQAWGAIEHSLRTGSTAFDHHYGKPVFDWFGEHPHVAELFTEAMTSTTRMTEQAILAAHDFHPFRLAVDVGGSRGTLLESVLEEHPEARGIVFDLPEIVAVARPHLDPSRVDAVAGNFFECVPSGDLYLLKQILHDWNDGQCAAILRNIRAAIRPHGRVCICEIVLPERTAHHPGYLMDLNMLAMTGGRERTAREFETLLGEAGFRLERITPTASMMSVVEAVAS